METGIRRPPIRPKDDAPKPPEVDVSYGAGTIPPIIIEQQINPRIHRQVEYTMRVGEGYRHYVRGNDLLVLCRYEDAVRYYTASIGYDSTQPAAFHQRALAHFDCGHIDEAIEDCKSALALLPDSVPTLCARARAYLFRRPEVGRPLGGRSKEARERDTYHVNLALSDASAAIALNSEGWEQFALHGETLSRMERWREAEESLTRAIALNPMAHEACTTRAHVRVRLNDSKIVSPGYADALEDYAELIRIHPSDQAYCERGRVYMRMGAYHEALADFTAAIRFSDGTRPGAAYHGRGRVNLELGRLEAGIQDFTAALKLNPNNLSARQHRDAAIRRLPKAARKAYEKYQG